MITFFVCALVFIGFMSLFFKTDKQIEAEKLAKRQDEQRWKMQRQYEEQRHQRYLLEYQQWFERECQKGLQPKWEPEPGPTVNPATTNTRPPIKPMPPAKPHWLAKWILLGVFTVGAGVLFVDFFTSRGGDSQPPPEASSSRTKMTPVPKLSGKPIVGYRLLKSRQKAARRSWMHVIVERRIDEQEIIDLAITLHNRYPDTRFNICDDSSGLNELDRHADSLEATAFPMKWAKKHYFAMVNIFVRDGEWKWRLAACEAHPGSFEDGYICDLENKTIMPSEYADQHK